MGALVLRRCQLLLQNPHEAEDALQDVFVRAMRYGGSVRQREVPLSWFYRTAERVCFDRLGRRGREPVGEKKDVSANGTLVDTGFPSTARRLEAAELVERFFYRLEPRLRQLAILHYVDGLPQERIAAELSWSRRTVGKKLKNLRQSVKRMSSREGVAP